MVFVRNPHSTNVYDSNYQDITSLTGAYRSVVQIAGGGSQGSGIYIAPNLVLTAHHVIDSGSASSWRAISGLGPFPEFLSDGTRPGVAGSAITPIRTFSGGFQTSDMAVLRVAEPLPQGNTLMGLAVIGTTGNQAANTALENATTAGFPGLIYSSAAAAAAPTMAGARNGDGAEPYIMRSLQVDASGEVGRWISDGVGAAGHSGGPQRRGRVDQRAERPRLRGGQLHLRERDRPADGLDRAL